MTTTKFHGGRVYLHQGDCLDVLRMLPDACIDSICTDPPYALVSVVKRFGAANAAPARVPEGGSGAYARASSGFMGKTWDTGETAFSVVFWSEAYRVLKPGGHVLAFAATRTYHRLACAIEDAGFEIRDMTAWLYGVGFPKSHDVALSFEKTLATRVDVPGGEPVWLYLDDEEPMATKPPFRHAQANEWAGWGTALKPALEPIAVARKPLIGTVAENVLAHGVGGLNIDACRVPSETRPVMVRTSTIVSATSMSGTSTGATSSGELTNLGRHPANVIHDGSDEVLTAFPAQASRFYYSAKATKADRAGSTHPTVKPVALMQYLIRLVTPPGGLVLDPFAGSGTTAQAALLEGMRCVLVEREAEYCADIVGRMERLTPDLVAQSKVPA